MTRAPTIGAYRRDESEEVPAEMVARKREEPTPAKTLSTGIEEDLKDSVDRTKPGVEKVKTYEELLAEHKISITKAHMVVDSILEKGFYEETYEIRLPTKTPLMVVLRTRTQADYMRFLRALEAYAPRYVDEQRDLQSRHFLASSLVSFRGKVFRRDVTSEENSMAAFQERLDWLEQQPERIVALLSQKLYEFDVMINTIMSEGIIENF